MVPVTRVRINSGALVKMGAFVISVTLSVLASGVPTRAQDVTTDDATAVLDGVLGFLRAHPRVRGRFDHLYRDRSRQTELRSSGRFAIELPRIGITMDGGDAHTIAIDATTAHVLVPRDGEADLLLAFRIDTTPLPMLLAVIAGTTQPTDAYAVRLIPAEGDHVLELRPNDPGSQVDRIWIESGASGAVTRIMVVDWRGATHRVVLTETSYPARIPESALAPVFPADAVTIEP